MKLDMIGIVVDDMKVSQTFYQKIGLSTKGEFNEDYMELQSDTIRISLNSKKVISGVYGFEPRGSGHEIEIAFIFQSVKELNDKCLDIKNQGIEFLKEPADVFWGQRYAVIKDPSGNLISLFANL